MSGGSKYFNTSNEAGGLRCTAVEDLVAKHHPAQRAFLLEAIAEARGTVILDLSRVEMVDSMGLTLVIRLFNTCKEKACPFRVEGASPELGNLFKVLSLSELFPVTGR